MKLAKRTSTAVCVPKVMNVILNVPRRAGGRDGAKINPSETQSASA